MISKKDWVKVDLSSIQSPKAKDNLLRKNKKPSWLRVKLPSGKKFTDLRKIVDKHKLHTICESGNCPNMGECWGAGTATFMILGNVCTRSCGFCAVATGRPSSIDWSEPERVAQSVKLMDIKHCFITSVDRDDLEDGGANIWVQTIQAVRRLSPKTTLETLIPDFKGLHTSVEKIANVNPEIVSHNLETVRRLTANVRIQAKYDRSLEVLRLLKEMGVKRTKSGIMLGLGEKEDEVISCLHDMRKVGIDIVTLGQYLQPTKKHIPVKRFVKPEEFNKYKEIGLKLGFKYVESGPLVRSSYHAEKHLF
ncbi:MAG: lipoyl synthase [Flavobacteriales bacterium]|nr:lipoyl synthase [Flavobacteriales bacterium]